MSKLKSKTNKIGFALSGGGSKGLAQAGALKYLDEQNIMPSIIAGTSAGAIIGAMYSWGKSPDEILDFFKSIYFFKWKHLTLRKPGIIDSDSFKKYFQDVFGESTIEELKIPTLITATDLVLGELKVFSNDTKITDALLASSSFPGMISPYDIDGHLYADGGILNHFPVDLIESKCDYKLGIYVSPLEKVTANDLRSIKSVTSRAFDLFSANSNIPKFSQCDWLIAPEELSQFSTFETSKSKMDSIFKIGYNSAKNFYENNF